MEINKIDDRLKILRELEKKEKNPLKVIYYNKEIIKLIDKKLQMSENKTSSKDKLKIKKV